MTASVPAFVLRRTAAGLIVSCAAALSLLLPGCSEEVTTPIDPSSSSVTGTYRDTPLEAVKWIYPLPQGNHVRGVAYVGSGKYFAVAGPGTVLESRGEGWSWHFIGREDLNCVWGLSPSAVYVGGESGVVYQYDGATWRQLPPAGSSWIWKLSGSSKENIWCVTSQDVKRYDGTQWRPVSQPPGDRIRDLWVTARGLVYGIGASTIYYRRGNEWVQSYSDPGLRLEGICGSDPSNLYVVATTGNYADGLVLSREATGWERRDLPSPYFLQIASNGDDTWVFSGDRFYELVGDQILNGPAGPFDNIRGIAVGEQGSLVAGGWRGMIASWDGTSWSRPYEPEADAFGDWCAVVPYRGALAVFGWTSGYYLRIDHGLASRQPLYVGHVTDAWTAPDNGELFLVTYNGEIAREHDGQWFYDQSGTESALWSLHGTSSSDVWAVGDHGVILHFDGNQWERSEPHLSETLMAVWASAPNDVYASYGDFLEYDGGGGLIHFDGDTWTEVAHRPSYWGVRGLWGAPDGVYLAGAVGVVSRFHEGNLETVYDAGPDDLLGINGNSDGTIYVGGYRTLLRRHNGVWENLPDPAEQALTDVHVEEDGSATAAGGLMAVLHIQRP